MRQLAGTLRFIQSAGLLKSRVTGEPASQGSPESQDIDPDHVLKPGVEKTPGFVSPIVAAGKRYVVTRRDGTRVIPTTTTFSVESVNKFISDDTDFNATPAIYNNHLIFR